LGLATAPGYPTQAADVQSSTIFSDKFISNHFLKINSIIYKKQSSHLTFTKKTVLIVQTLHLRPFLTRFVVVISPANKEMNHGSELV